jgi:hypothetical protein
LPVYITQTRSATSATTPRSWVISKTANFLVLSQVVEQLEDLSLDRYVESRRRLVGDQKLEGRTQGPSRSSHAAALPPES